MKIKYISGLAFLGIVAGVLIVNACSPGIPKKAEAVKPFDIERYLGKWYEIARMDVRFERNLNNTTAHYSLYNDGTIKVVNRGYNYITGEWKEATGKAKPVAENTGRLKVSFFGPFYSGYNIIALDDEYRYSLVAGNGLQYLWILSRETSVPESVKQNYLSLAKDIGYDTSALIWVEHDRQQ